MWTVRYTNLLIMIYTNEVTIFSSDLPKFLEYNLEAAEWNETEQLLPQLVLKDFLSTKKITSLKNAFRT